MNNIVEKFFYNLILKQRFWLIEKSKKKIEKLSFKLSVQQHFYNSMVKETEELINKGTYL